MWEVIILDTCCHSKDAVPVFLLEMFLFPDNVAVCDDLNFYKGVTLRLRNLMMSMSLKERTWIASKNSATLFCILRYQLFILVELQGTFCNMYMFSVRLSRKLEPNVEVVCVCVRAGRGARARFVGGGIVRIVARLFHRPIRCLVGVFPSGKSWG
jgi:hypothetical protein